MNGRGSNCDEMVVQEVMCILTHVDRSSAASSGCSKSVEALRRFCHTLCIAANFASSSMLLRENIFPGITKKIGLVLSKCTYCKQLNTKINV